MNTERQPLILKCDYLIALILLASLSTVFGQDKVLNGTYADTLRPHKIILTIQDNDKFTIDEFMSEGKRTLSGTWAFRDNLISLKTIKIWYWDKKTPNERKEYIPKDFPDTFISMDKNKQLTLLAPKNTEQTNTRLQKIK